MVHSLDRLGRSLSGLLGIVGTLAQYERKLINERVADACAAAKARGKQTGRPRALAPEQVALARRMRAAGESIATICGALKISRATLYRVLGDQGAAEPV